MKKTPTLQFYKTRKGLHRWRLRGANGENICQGTSVKTFRACKEQVILTGDYLGLWWTLNVPKAPRTGVNVVEIKDFSGRVQLTVERWA